MERNKSFVVLFFILITLVTTLKTVGTMGYYLLDTSTFIERFCVNKDKPELHCDGKCELAKMLKQDTEKSDSPINIEFLKIEVVLFLNTLINLDFTKSIVDELVEVAYCNTYDFSILSRIKHPPKV